MLVQIAKVLMLVFWAAFVFSFIQPFAGVMQTIVLWLGIVFAVVHALEWLVKRSALDAVNAGGVGGFVQTMCSALATGDRY